MIDSARALIAAHEGCTLVAIPDTRGYSIGYGRDGAAEGQTCTQEEAEEWLDQDMALAMSRAAADLGSLTWFDLDEVRRAVLTDMAYEMGGRGLAGFTDMLGAIRVQNWPKAQRAGLSSDWAGEVPARAGMDMRMLLTGLWPKEIA